jgi:hypothetical protein
MLCPAAPSSTVLMVAIMPKEEEHFPRIDEALQGAIHPNDFEPYLDELIEISGAKDSDETRCHLAIS